MTSEEFAIRRVRWQLFATLTFKREKLSQRHRYGLLFAWLRRLADSKEVHFKRLLFAVRAEAGESFGRFHYHVLISGLPVHEVNPSTCQFFEHASKTPARWSIAALWGGPYEIELANCLWNSCDCSTRKAAASLVPLALGSAKCMARESAVVIENIPILPSSNCWQILRFS